MKMLAKVVGELVTGVASAIQNVYSPKAEKERHLPIELKGEGMEILPKTKKWIQRDEK